MWLDFSGSFGVLIKFNVFLPSFRRLKWFSKDVLDFGRLDLVSCRSSKSKVQNLEFRATVKRRLWISISAWLSDWNEGSTQSPFGNGRPFNRPSEGRSRGENSISPSKRYSSWQTEQDCAIVKSLIQLEIKRGRSAKISLILSDLRNSFANYTGDFFRPYSDCSSERSFYRAWQIWTFSICQDHEDDIYVRNIFPTSSILIIYLFSKFKIDTQTPLIR